MVLFCVERNREILLYPCPTQKKLGSLRWGHERHAYFLEKLPVINVRSQQRVRNHVNLGTPSLLFFRPAAASAHDIQFPHSRAALQAPSTASSMILKRNPRDRFSSQSTLSGAKNGVKLPERATFSKFLTKIRPNFRQFSI